MISWVCIDKVDTGMIEIPLPELSATAKQRLKGLSPHFPVLKKLLFDPLNRLNAALAIPFAIDRIAQGPRLKSATKSAPGVLLGTWVGVPQRSAPISKHSLGSFSGRTFGHRSANGGRDRNATLPRCNIHLDRDRAPSAKGIAIVRP